jgi:fructose-1-phosphate kinase PfkB-like protein
MLASAILAVKNGDSAPDILKKSIAAGSSAATCSMTELISIETYERLKEEVQVSRVNV